MSAANPFFAWMARDAAYPIEAPTWIASGDLIAIVQPETVQPTPKETK